MGNRILLVSSDPESTPAMVLALRATGSLVDRVTYVQRPPSQLWPPPDLVLADLEGEEVTDALTRLLDPLPRVPLILLSSLRLSQLSGTLRKLPPVVDAVLFKPFSIDALFTAVRRSTGTSDTRLRRRNG